MKPNQIIRVLKASLLGLTMAGPGEAGSHENLAQAQLLVNTYLIATKGGGTRTGFVVKHEGQDYLISTEQLGRETEEGKKVQIHAGGKGVETKLSLIGISQRYGASIFERPEELETEVDLDVAVMAGISLGQHTQWYGPAVELGIWITESGQITSFQLPSKWRELEWSGWTASGRGHPGLAGAPMVVQDSSGKIGHARVFGMIRASDPEASLLAVSPVEEIIKDITKEGEQENPEGGEIGE